MKKQNLKSLALKKNIVANFDEQELIGGRTGAVCQPTFTCVPPSAYHSCRYTEQYSCSLQSIVYCTA